MCIIKEIKSEYTKRKKVLWKVVIEEDGIISTIGIGQADVQKLVPGVNKARDHCWAFHGFGTKKKAEEYMESLSDPSPRNYWAFHHNNIPFLTVKRFEIPIGSYLRTGYDGNGRLMRTSDYISY